MLSEKKTCTYVTNCLNISRSQAQQYYFFYVELLSYQVRNLLSSVDTGRKLNVHTTFRRRPGSLVNVLCKFNLRPVSTESAVLLLLGNGSLEKDRANLPDFLK